MTYVTRVLIIDDNDSICQSLKLILDRKGYNTDIASTGKGALMKAQASEFHIALVDIHLPDMTGLDLLEKLIDQYPQISIIIITGHASKQTAIRAVENGAEVYIEKPLDIESLLQTLSQISERKRNEYEKLQKDQEIALSLIESEECLSLLRNDIRNEIQIIASNLESALNIVDEEDSELKNLLKLGLEAAKQVDSLINTSSQSGED